MRGVLLERAATKVVDDEARAFADASAGFFTWSRGAASCIALYLCVGRLESTLCGPARGDPTVWYILSVCRASYLAGILKPVT